MSGCSVLYQLLRAQTVIKWHRQSFKCYWRWKSRAGRVGRPRIDQEIRDLIRRMLRENPTWGVPRIQAELNLLGYKVAESTVAKYRVRARKPPSQTWKSFLRNHANEIVAIDFFVVPTVTFNILYGFVVLLHNRRQVVHFNATPIRLRCGPHNRSLKPFRKRQRHDSCRGIVIQSMGKSFEVGWEEWESKK